jgi:hypothetical protein
LLTYTASGARPLRHPTGRFDVQGLPAIPLAVEAGAGQVVGLLLPLWLLAVLFGASATSAARTRLRRYDGDRWRATVRWGLASAPRAQPQPPPRPHTPRLRPLGAAGTAITHPSGRG